ncbi:cytochrome P450 [Yinghuangia seranimata]|uniref:cytochrome P450 n=1 Tax=Yinghuangia seranimata TaxID=408067 RepID=UPI00248B8001|nr:cytochrome P450 [Yinghuangia seranimata]MDI2129898.1 cytochrome P450 [Yinghuangia seranimata]
MTAQLPFAVTGAVEPPRVQRELQGKGPVHRIRTRVGDEAWLITGYPQVRALADDPRLGRSHPDPDNAPRLSESALIGRPTGEFETELAEHARNRALLQPYFSPRRMRTLRPRVAELAGRFLDDLAAHDGGPVDFNPVVALPLPIMVICELLGVPYEDREQFRAWSEAAGNADMREHSHQGLIELFTYGTELVARKRRTPGDDLISGLCAEDSLRDDEIAVLSMTLLFAGHETTVAQIGLGALLLLTQPGQWQGLLDAPDRIAPLVEEIMRAPMSGTGGLPRWARADFEVDGHLIRTGDLVLLDIAAANHDPAVFEDPDRFDPDRGAVPHLGFGYGGRYCLGAPLARMEMQEVLGQMAQRFPELRLAIPVEEVRFHDDRLQSGVVELPVVW